MLDAAELKKEALQEMNEDRMRAFKAAVKNGINAIANTQTQIAQLQLQLAAQQKTLREMSVEEIKADVLGS